MTHSMDAASGSAVDWKEPPESSKEYKDGKELLFCQG